VQPAGFEDDAIKYGEAAALGWFVLRVTGRMVKNDSGIDLLERTLSMVEREKLYWDQQQA
jgi:hypothetical protein